jgi:hypothetical protein
MVAFGAQANRQMSGKGDKSIYEAIKWDINSLQTWTFKIVWLGAGMNQVAAPARLTVG